MNIPVGSVAPWKRAALQKVIGFASLAQNWDALGSNAPGMAVSQTACGLLLSIPEESLPVPRVVPVSGGGLHFEWSQGNRELELSIEPDCRIEVLKVEHGMPLEEAPEDLPAVFAWLASE